MTLIKLHNLKPAKGSRRPKHRVGRGIAGKGGKTAGRGTKGQKARDTVKPGFEGGQLKLTQRIPKLKGFKNPFRVSYRPIGLSVLDSIEVEEITLEKLVETSNVKKGEFVKILANGTINSRKVVHCHSISKSAKEAIEAKGGTVIQVPLPFVRPPKRGSAIANR